MKIATWNVNGIRARQAQFCEWLARDRPDVVCLQELKAEPAQIPPQCKLDDYHVYWHGLRALLRRVAARQQGARSTPSRCSAIPISTWSRASCRPARQPGPRFGLRAERRQGLRRRSSRFMQRLAAWAKQLHGEGRELVLCGDINIARTDMDVHPRERKPGIIGQRPEERELFERLLGEHLVDVGRALDPDNANLSPGGRRGATCASATSAGASTTSSLRRRSPRARRAASCSPISAPATTRRSS